MTEEEKFLQRKLKQAQIYESGLLGLNKMFVGSDLTRQELMKHLAGKPYNNQQIINNSVSDATDGYHIRSGKDYGELASGNLTLGGIPAALAGMAYQQFDGIADSSIWDGNFSKPFGTFGKNAFLQSVDNIEGLRQSGKAPALDALYNFGGGVHNLFNNPSSIDVTALGGPRAKGNIFNQGQIEVNPTVRPTVQPQGPAGFTQPTNQPINQPITPAYQPLVQPTTPAQPTPVKSTPIPTYNRPQGPAGYTRPTRSYAQQAATVNREG